MPVIFFIFTDSHSTQETNLHKAVLDFNRYYQSPNFYYKFSADNTSSFVCAAYWSSLPFIMAAASKSAAFYNVI
jgi:hypothetical protein